MTHHPTISGPASPATSPTPSSEPSQVRRLTRQLEQSINEQFQQMDTVLDQLLALVETEGDLTGAWNEFEQQRVEWERQCESVSQQVQQEYRLLAEAWEKIEQQNRKLAAGAKVPPSSDRPVTGPPSQYEHSAGVPRQSQSAADAPQPLPVAATPKPVELDICDAWSPRLNDSAVVQFQQMKRQIRSHIADSRRK